MAYVKKKKKEEKKIEIIQLATEGKLVPQHKDFEKAVLGALMLEKDAYYRVSEILKPESFYEQPHILIFKAIMALATDNRPIDILTVRDQLEKSGDLSQAGGASYVSQLTENMASTAHLEYHAKIVAQKFLARELIHYTGVIQGKAFEEETDVDELMQEADSELFRIAQRNIKSDAVQISSVLHEAKDLIEKAGAKDEGISGLGCGYEKIDRITSGWQNSDLVIIAARPSMGKTAFALSMAKNMAMDYQYPVAFFSLEMSNIQLVNRLIMNACEIKGDIIKSGKLSRDEWDVFDYKIKDLYKASIFIDDTPSLSIFELRTKARRLVREHGIKCIFIDYLQLMNAGGGTNFGSREQEVSTISRSLKSLAKELNIPIIALSQLNRNVEGKGREGLEGKKPQLSDLRESGAIEQDADIVCFIHRPEYYRFTEDSEGNSLVGKAQIIIAKHRNGAISDKIWLNFKGEFAKFTNIDETEAMIYRDFPSKMNGMADISSPVSPVEDDFIAHQQGMPF